MTCQRETDQAHRVRAEAEGMEADQARDGHLDVEQAQSLAARRENVDCKHAFWVPYMKVVG